VLLIVLIMHSTILWSISPYMSSLFVAIFVAQSQIF
jgi:hypothetical protein